MSIANDARDLCKILGFSLKNGAVDEIYEKYYSNNSTPLTINITMETINYKDIGITVGRETTSNLSEAENLVVLECVDKLLTKGYVPTDIFLEKGFNVGRSGKSGWLDILVSHNRVPYMMIECKTYGKEYEKARKILLTSDNTESNNQLLSYFTNDTNVDVLCLYASRVADGKIDMQRSIIYTEHLKTCHNATEAYHTWDKKLYEFGIFDDDILPYQCRDRLKRGQLTALTEEDSSRIFNQFLEILRHNGISDKPNAFNKILNLFLCKIVDEEKNEDEDVDFYWSANSTYNSMQSTLEALYKKGMQQYLNIDITDHQESDIRKKLENILGTSNPNLVTEIVTAFRETKCHKSSEFAFKEIYNQETFEANAKVLKEIIELLQGYQFRYAHKQQFLGTFFENLLATSIKQEVGQFFTPVPIARFMITSLPLQKALTEKAKKALNGKFVVNVIPTVIDYSCGSGHFLTEFMDLMQKVIDDCDVTPFTESVKKKLRNQQNSEFDWASECIYGVEKDYRLVKTTKISTFLNGDGEANIIHADGLTAFGTKNFQGLLNKAHQFDFVIANPPYSVSNFKSELTNTEFSGYKYLTDESKEIECLFIERTAQLLTDGGYAAVILPTSVVSNGGIYEDARQNILKHFHIRGIAKMGKNTFMSTNVETIILFLQKRNIEDYNHALNIVNLFWNDKKDFHFNGIINVVHEYAKKHDLTFEDYLSILDGNPTVTAQESNYYHFCGAKSDDKKTKSKKTGFSEKDKLINFMLTYMQPCAIINTGSKDEEKQFLGYEFSNRRGHEGLHEYDEGSSLYDVSDPLNDNPEKANYLIKQVFLGNIPTVPECLSNNARIVAVDDIIDFMAGNKFNVNAKIDYSSKYEKVFLSTLIEKLESGSRPEGGKTKLTSGVISIGGENVGSDNSLNLEKITFVSDEFYNKSKQGKIFNGDIIINKDGACTGKLTRFTDSRQAISNEHCFVLNAGNNQDYLFYLLQHSTYNKMLNQIAQKATQPGLSRPDLENIKVPLPPKNIQESIAQECGNVDVEIEKSKQEINAANDKISALFSSLSCPMVKLGNSKLFTVLAGGDAPARSMIKRNPINEFDVPIYSNGTGESALYGYTSKSDKTIKHDAVTIAARGSIGYSELRTAPFLPIVRLIVVYPNTTDIDLNYLRFAIQQAERNIIDNSNGSSIQQLTVPMTQNIEIPLPTLEVQKDIATKALALQSDIERNQQVILKARLTKDSIVDKYLK